MKKILFIAAHRPDRSPSQRFRFENYFEYWTQNGFQCDLSYIISERADTFFYKPGHYLGKFGVVITASLHRLADAWNANKYDIIFIQREAFMLGTTLFERLLKLSRAKLVFDFDDSIWLLDISEANRKIAFLKNPSKTSQIIGLCDLVIAGNQYLADYAKKFNTHVEIIPTTIDTDKYFPLKNHMKSGPITIGWSGSFSTIKHFSLAIPALIELKRNFGEQIHFVVVGDQHYRFPELEIIGKKWTPQTEVDDVRKFDIGIMPLPDDEWSRGKCGFKGILYMSLGIPAVLSPVGVNRQIIKDNMDGMLASTTEEWIEKLSYLISNPEIRLEMGRKGREKVIQNYSVQSQKTHYLQLFRQLMGESV